MSEEQGKRVSVWMPRGTAERIADEAAIIGATPAVVVALALLSYVQRGACPRPVSRVGGDVRARYQIPARLYEWVQECARREGASVAAIVRGALYDYLGIDELEAAEAVPEPV